MQKWLCYGIVMVMVFGILFEERRSCIKHDSFSDWFDSLKTLRYRLGTPRRKSLEQVENLMAIFAHDVIWRRCFLMSLTVCVVVKNCIFPKLNTCQIFTLFLLCQFGVYYIHGFVNFHRTCVVTELMKKNFRVIAHSQ